MKHRKIRKALGTLKNVILVNATPPDGTVETVDNVLDAAYEALGREVRHFASNAWRAVREWVEGKKPGALDDMTGTYNLDPRTELYAALDGFDYIFQRAGYPSWQQLRDEWPDAVEG